MIDYKKKFHYLCDELDVPRIPVKVKPLTHEYAYFSENYQVVFDPNCPEKYIKHEFCHYIIKLLRRESDLEEWVCYSVQDET